MVVVEKPIHAVIYHVLVHPSVSNSTILAGMPVKVANLPIGGVNTLIRIMKIVAMEGLRLIEHIHGDEYVHRKKEQQQQEEEYEKMKNGGKNNTVGGFSLNSYAALEQKQQKVSKK